MNLRQDIDFSTLNWVKDELDETLRQARVALDAFAEDSEDASQMRFCATYLHQAHGTLRMVELYGAALLVEEMETVALGLLEGDVKQSEEVYGVLMRALVQLPDYLERLEGGHRDIPVVLLPLLNDLRAARGAKLLSENVLFSPDLTRELPESAVGPDAPIAPDVLKPAVAKLRGAFELALLRWIQDESSTPALQRLGAVMERLQRVTFAADGRRLWWVCGGLVETLLNGKFDSLVSVKLLFGRIDRTMRQFVEEGEQGFAKNPPESLTRSVLYYVAQVPASGQRTRELHDLYELSDLLPKAEELEHAEGSLSGRNRELFDTVSGAIKDDLLRVKDALDLHLRQEAADLAELAPLADELDRVADTLGMLGLGVPRKVILDQKNTVAAVASGERDADEKTLLDVAGALLYVESSLDDHIDSLGHASQDDEPETQEDTESAGFDLPRSEVRRILDALISEATGNLQTVKQAVVDFIESPWEHDKLLDAPGQLDEIGGAMRMLDLPRPAACIAGLERYFREELLEKRVVPEPQQLDQLADVVASIEYYFEGLREQRSQPQSILDVAQSSLQALGFDIDAPDDAAREDADADAAEFAADVELGLDDDSLSDAEWEAPETEDADVGESLVADLVDGEADDMPELAELAEGDAADGDSMKLDLDLESLVGAEDTADFAAELAAETETESSELSAEELEPDTLDDVATDSELLDEESEQISDAAEEPSETASESTENVELEDVLSETPDAEDDLEPTAAAVADHPEFVVGEVDDDIREIFEEEFQEELEAQATHYPQWRDDPENRESLAVLRRSFHTLKGSGRLVGAAGIGEFAWKVEDLLNPLVDGEQTPSSALLAAMDHVIDVMPQMYRTLTEGVQPTTNVAALEDVLTRLRDGEEAWFDAEPAATPAPEESAANAADVADPDDSERADEATQDASLEDAVADLEKAESVAEDDGDATNEVLPVDEDEVANALGLGEFADDDSDSAESSTSGVSVEFDAEPESSFDLSDADEADLDDVIASLGGDDALSLDGIQGDTPEAADDSTESPTEETADLDSLADSEFALDLESESVPDAESEPETDTDAQPETEAESEPQREPIDPTLLEILRGEVAAHVGVVDAYLESVSSDSDTQADSEAAMRATHTLTGATAMVDIESLRVLCEPMERLIKELHARGDHPDSEGRGVLAEATRLIQATVDQLEHGSEVDLPPTAECAERLVQLVEGLPARESGRDEVSFAELDAPEALEFGAEDEAEPEASNDSDIEVAADVDDAEEDAADSSEIEPEAATEPEEDLQDLDVDDELLEIFVEEAAEILDEAERFMSSLRDNVGDPEAIGGLQRELHTLKGGARMAGISPIGDLSHVMESLLEAVVEGDVEIENDGLDALESGFDRLHGMLQTVRAREPLAAAKSAITRLESLIGKEVPPNTELDVAASLDQPAPTDGASEEEPASLAEAPSDADDEPADEPHVEAESEPQDDHVPRADEPADEPAEPAVADDVTQKLLGDAVGAPAARPSAEDVLEKALSSKSDLVQFDEPKPAEPAQSGPRPQQEIIRVRSELLDSLVNHAGEVSIYRSRLEQQVGSFRFNLIEFDQTVSRLREQLRKLEIETETQILSRFKREVTEQDDDFDPLEMDRFSQIQELSRALAESVSDLVSIQNMMDDLTRQSETLLLQQSRVSSDLQEGLMRTRMVPFDSLVPRLRRILRQTSNELGKKSQLRVTGAQGEMDRTVLERITAPLEHMLRNALAHGLEAPDVRTAAGKDEAGTINITVSREATEVVLQVADDGAGIDRDVVRRKAVERGLLRDDATLSDRDIYGFILETGFSTAEKVTKVSGRGVGMDVVNSEIKQLGGSLDIDSVPGKGTVFTIRLPFTLAVTHAIMVRANDQTFAVPLSSVQGVVRLQKEDFERRVAENDATYNYAGEEFQIQELHTLLGQQAQAVTEEDQVPILMIRSGDQRAAIRVDAVTGSREVVVKSVGPQVASVPGIFGATILGDGRVILILDLGPLVRRGAALQLAPEVPSADAERAARRPLIMVVDDSITMRKVTSRVLERNDMEVVTAKDGVDAVAALQERVPDLMLLDIEMPRMDGYELASHMRNDGRLQSVPIIMITSRTGEKHRQRAEEIGVERYLGKPYQEAELLEHVSELLDERAVN